MKGKKVVIIGGGFGGFHTARRLVRKGLDILLISDKDYFVFTPLLVEVATGSLEPADITFKFTDYFKSKKFDFILGRVTKVDMAKNQVTVNGKVISYDYLVLATGSKKRQLRVDGEKHTLSLKTLDDALIIRKVVTDQANDSSNVSHINVVGAGPTGVELIFGIAQLLTRTNKSHQSILRLFDSQSKLFPFLSDNVRFYIDRLLKNYSIDLFANTSVKLITDNEVNTEDQAFRSDITILAIGVIPNTDIIDDKYLDDSKQVIVNDALQVKGVNNIFALGDIITIGETKIPKLAQTASDQSKIVAKNILRLIKNQTLKSYSLYLKGELISTGEGRAVGTIMGVMVRGRLSYFLRCGAYMTKMPRLKNKMRLFRAWSTSFFKAIGL